MFEGLKDFWRAITTSELEDETKTSEDAEAKKAKEESETSSKTEKSATKNSTEPSVAGAVLYVSNKAREMQIAYLDFFTNNGKTDNPDLINLIDVAYCQLHGLESTATKSEAKPKQSTTSTKPATSTKKTATSAKKATTSGEKTQASVAKATPETPLEVSSKIKVISKIWFYDQNNRAIGQEKIKEQLSKGVKPEELESHGIKVIVGIFDENGKKLRDAEEKDYKDAFNYLRKYANQSN